MSYPLNRRDVDSVFSRIGTEERDSVSFCLHRNGRSQQYTDVFSFHFSNISTVAVPSDSKKGVREKILFEKRPAFYARRIFVNAVSAASRKEVQEKILIDGLPSFYAWHEMISAYRQNLDIRTYFSLEWNGTELTQRCWPVELG